MLIKKKSVSVIPKYFLQKKIVDIFKNFQFKKNFESKNLKFSIFKKILNQKKIPKFFKNVQ